MPFATALAVLPAALGASAPPLPVPKVVSARPVRRSRAASARRRRRRPRSQCRRQGNAQVALWELRDGIDPATATDGPLAPGVVAAKDGDRVRQAVRCFPRRAPPKRG